MIISRIKKIAEETPEKIAYKVNEQSITYQELWKKANQEARLLKKEGTGPVLIFGSKEIEVFICMIACLIANRPYVPISVSTPLERLKKIIKITQAELLISVRNLSIEGIRCLKPADLKQVESQEDKKSMNELAYIMFTSGSTGDPKGVPISKQNLNHFIEWISHLDPLSKYKECIVLNQAEFSFDLSVADLYYSLYNGHTLVAWDRERKDNNGIFSLFREEQVNIAMMTPTFMKLLLLNEEFQKIKVPSFQCVYFCGERLDVKMVRKLLERFPHLDVINAYGPTEATSAVSAIPITKAMLDEEELLPVGEVATSAVEIEIEQEEIILKGKSVFGGYLQENLEGSYQENGIFCYRTKDRGSIKNGKIYCRGRKDSQIKYKGYRIELGDIENNLNQILKVKESIVLAKYNQQNEVKTIQAFVKRETCDCTVDYIKDQLKKRLPEYMIPRTIKIVNEFPVNQNDKIDRKELARQ